MTGNAYQDRSMSRVLIAGCGDVGSALGRLLVGAGHRAYGLRRNTDALPAELEPVAADLGEPASLAAALPREVDVLVYTAAASGFDDAAYRQAYVVGLRNVLGALDRSRLSRVLFVSSTGVYGQDDGDWVDEDSPTGPPGFSGRRLLEGEAQACSAGVPAVSVRFGGIYGPGRTRLMDRVRSGEGCAAQPVLWTNRIHRDDCAGVLHHLVELERPQATYIGVDCEPAPQCVVMDWLADHMGVPHPPRTAPGMRRRGGNKRCSNQRLMDSGYRFVYPTFREGYAQVLSA
jgi:nucleoside-diphosphate-sugar epimerase